MTNNNWEQAQEWEKKWHGNCHNTYGEEMKQLVYAEKMGLVRSPNNSTPFRFDLQEKRVLDIGCGPASLLLKCDNVDGFAIDPMAMPKWVKDRYAMAGIHYLQIKGEDLNRKGFDEILIYNVLQHTENPEKIIENAKRAGKIIRIFEWIDTPTNIGHIHTLTEKKLNEWLGGEGKVEILNTINLKGKCYYGVFPTKKV